MFPVPISEAVPVIKWFSEAQTADKSVNKTKVFDIYEEGFCVMEGSAQAYYVGSAEGKDFLDACKNYIANHPQAGEIRKFSVDGREYEYACSWGCRWFPTLAEAQRSFG